MTISIRSHTEYARTLARGICRGRLDPDDLAQDAIERWLRALPTLPPTTNHQAWLTTVLRNLFIDQLRRRDARRELPADCARFAIPAVDSLPWWLELCACDIDRELDQLPADQRTTFQLFAFEGKTYDEIAAAQGIARATVGTRILRARRSLKALLVARAASRSRDAASRE
jgi:RNA polymerase sigma-70 factor, ECF subfamily